MDRGGGVGSERKPTPRRLDAQQAADRLGIKVESLYAYVSRGLIASERAVDGRSSTFRVDDVERLAARGRPRRSSRGPTVDVSIWTSITEIAGGHLRYRGQDAVELSSSASFEQVAELLWHGRLADEAPTWPIGRDLPFCPVEGRLLDRLRAAVALDACRPRPDPETGPEGAAELVAEGPGLLATMVDSLVAVSGAVSGARVPTLTLADGTTLKRSIAGRLTIGLRGGAPSAPIVPAVNSALVLLADHEMASSTFAARVAASVRADAHAVLSAGMGPVAGPYHGQASRVVRATLDAAQRTSPAAVARRLSQRSGPVAGFGHGLYPHGDPRATALLEVLFDAVGPTRGRRLVEEVLGECTEAGVGRPNVDFALAAMGHIWSMPVDAGEAIFAVARSAGWLAHGAEEWDRRPVRFRARARYTGSPSTRTGHV